MNKQLDLKIANTAKTVDAKLRVYGAVNNPKHYDRRAAKRSCFNFGTKKYF